MSGYIYLHRTGNEAFDKVLEKIEGAGHAFHHTRDWQDPVEWHDNKSYLELINELIDAVPKVESEK